jgi:hypothetical protein
MGALATMPLVAGIATTPKASLAAERTGANLGAMTTSEACRLLVDLLRQLAAARADRDEVKAELAVVLAERDVYREMVSVAMTQLHQKHTELKHERDSRFRLLADYRALRGHPCR